MNPILVFLILLSAFFLWMLCSGMFAPIGQMVSKIIENINKNIKGDKKEEHYENRKRNDNRNEKE